MMGIGEKNGNVCSPKFQDPKHHFANIKMCYLK